MEQQNKVKKYVRTYEAIHWDGNIRQLEEFVGSRILRLEFQDDKSMMVTYGKDLLCAKFFKAWPDWMIYRQSDGRIESCSKGYFFEFMGCEEVKYKKDDQ